MSIPAAVLSRPEHRVLLLSACHLHSPSVKRDFAGLMQQNLDWVYLLPRLRNHGLVALFSHHMQGRESALPARPRDVLQREFSQGLQRRLRMLIELQQIVEFLTAQGVPVLAYKGPILAQIAYGSVALRPFSDLDLLVAPKDKNRAVELLGSQGYAPESDAVLPATLEHRRQLRDYEMALLSPQRAGALDLHWAVAPPYDGFPLHFEALWQRRTASELAPAVPTFCREDLILCLCVHGLKHGWHRLEWLGCLLGVLLRSAENPLQWPQIQSTAAKLRCERTLRLGLRLVFDLAAMDSVSLAQLRAIVPEDLSHDVARDAVAAQLARRVWKTLFEQEDNAKHEAFVTIPALIFALRAREGWRARWNYLRAISRAFLVPGVHELDNTDGSHSAMNLVRFQRLILRRLHRLIVLRRL